MAWIEPSPKKNLNYKGPWRVTYRQGGAKQHIGPFHTLPEARDEKAKRSAQEREFRKMRSGGGAQGTSLKALWKAYIQESISEGTIREETTAALYTRAVRPILERCPTLCHLTGTWGTDDWGRAIQEWKTEMLTQPCPQSVKTSKRLKDETLLRPYSSTSVSINLRTLHTFLLWCKRKKYLPTDPMEDFGLPKSKKRRDLVKGGKGEIHRLIDAAPNNRFRLFLTFSFYTGLRKGMIRQVDGSEIRGNMWTIPGHKAKTDRDITIPLHPRVQAALEKYFPKGIPTGPVFGNLSDSTIYTQWTATKKKAGVEYRLTIHGARRTWATQFMTRTQNLAALMEAGHWKDTRTAMTYQHLATAWLKKEIDTFEFD